MDVQQSSNMIAAASSSGPGVSLDANLTAGIRRRFTSLNRLTSNIDWVLLGLLGLLLAANLPFCTEAILPTHDTFYSLQVFHYFYSELLIHGRLPEWAPYHLCGAPTTYEQILCFTPAGCLTIVIGLLFRVTDVLALFRASMIVEQATFLLGLYLLSRRLYVSRMTVAFVSACGIGLSFWHQEVYFAFRLYSAWPFVLHLLLIGFERRQPRWLWLAGLLLAISMLGNGTYFLILWPLIGGTLFGCLAWRERAAWRDMLRHSRADWLAVGAFCLASCLILSVMLHRLDGLAITSIDRDPVTGANDVHTFLNYAVTPPHEVAESFLHGWPIQRDNSLYFGLLPLLLCAWAAVRVRTLECQAFLITAALLCAFAQGGLLATVSWMYLPGMPYFRHIGLTYNLIGLFVILAAGFGFEDFIRTASRGQLALGALLFVGLGDTLRQAMLHREFALAEMESPFWIRTLCYAAALVLGCLIVRSPTAAVSSGALAIVSGRRLFLAGALFVATLCDLGLYRAVTLEVHATPPALRQLSSAFVARVAPFQGRRFGLEPVLLQIAESCAELNRGGSSSAFTFQFAGIDRGQWHGHRNNVIPRNLGRIASARDWDWSQRPLPATADPALLDMLGLRASKLRFLERAIRFSTAETALERMSTLPNMADTLVLDGAESFVTTATARPAMDPPYRVTQFAPHRLELEVTIPDGQGGWLTYADGFAPGWRAEIDHQPVKVERAWLSFKAVRIEPGRHFVQFRYHSGLLGTLRYALFAFGAMAGLGAIVALLVTLVRRPLPGSQMLASDQGLSTERRVAA